MPSDLSHAERALGSTYLNARREAERRFPNLGPDEPETTYPRVAIPVLRRAAFVDGYLAGVAAAPSRPATATPMEMVEQIRAHLNDAEQALREANEELRKARGWRVQS